MAIPLHGTPCDPELLALSPARQSQPVLAAGAGEIVAVWTDREGDAAYLRTQVMTADAQPIRGSSVSLGHLATNDLSWNGTDFLTIVQTLDALLAIRINANGARLGEPIVLARYQRQFANLLARHATVAWTGQQWLVIWSDEGQLQQSFVTASGVATTPRTLTLGRPAVPPNMIQALHDPRLAFDGNRILLLFQETISEICWFPVCGSGEPHQYAIRLDRNADPIGSAIELPHGFDTSIATSGDEFVVISDAGATSLEVRNGTFAIVASRALPPAS